MCFIDHFSVSNCASLPMLFADRNYPVFQTCQFANNLQRWHAAKMELSFQLIVDCCSKSPSRLLIRWKLPLFGFFLLTHIESPSPSYLLINPHTSCSILAITIVGGCCTANAYTSVSLGAMAFRRRASEYSMLSSNSSFDGDSELQMYPRVKSKFYALAALKFPRDFIMSIGALE